MAGTLASAHRVTALENYACTRLSILLTYALASAMRIAQSTTEATMNPMPYEIVLGDFAQQWVLGRHLEQKVTGLRARSSR